LENGAAKCNASLTLQLNPLYFSPQTAKNGSGGYD